MIRPATLITARNLPVPSPVVRETPIPSSFEITILIPFVFGASEWFETELTVAQWIPSVNEGFDRPSSFFSGGSKSVRC